MNEDDKMATATKSDVDTATKETEPTNSPNPSAPNLSNDVLLVPASSGMVGFITNTWLMSFKDALPNRGVPNDIYFKFQHDLISNLIINGACLVAVLKTDPSQYLGFICYDIRSSVAVPSLNPLKDKKKQNNPHNPQLAVHYIYVKQRFRNLGLAKHKQNKPVLSFLAYQGDLVLL